MSFIAFDLDALNAAPAVARAAGVTENDVLGGLLRLWAWCFRSETDIVTELQLRGHFGVDAGPALEAFGFLAKQEADWRVRGAERYLKVKASQRSAAARTNARKTEAKLNGGASVDRRSTDAPPTVDRSVNSRPSPNTEHRTPIEERNVRTSELDDAVTLDMRRPPVNANVELPKKRRACAIIDTTAEPDPEPVPVVAGPVVYVLPTSDPSTWLAEDFWAWAQSQRQGAGLLGERTQPRGLSAWWGTARLTTSAEALCEAFVRFCADRDPYWAKATPQWPFAGFLKQWDRWVPATPVSRAPPRVDADVFAELRSRARELGAGGHVAEQLEQLRWERKGTGYVGVTEDGYHAQFIVEKFGPLLADLGATIDAPAVGGAA